MSIIKNFNPNKMALLGIALYIISYYYYNIHCSPWIYVIYNTCWKVQFSGNSEKGY